MIYFHLRIYCFNQYVKKAKRERHKNSCVIMLAMTIQKKKVVVTELKSVVTAP